MTIYYKALFTPKTEAFLDATNIIAARIKFILSPFFFVCGAYHKNGLVTPAMIKRDDVGSKRTLGYQSVSYTHLDVYKRQG